MTRKVITVIIAFEFIMIMCACALIPNQPVKTKVIDTKESEIQVYGDEITPSPSPRSKYTFNDIDDPDKAVQFMIDCYGLDVAYLNGLYLPRLIKDYKLINKDYTVEEIIQIIDENRDIYAYNNENIILDFSSKSGRTLQKEEYSDIKYLLLIEDICGDPTKYMYFDLDQRMCFDTNNEIVHSLDDEDIKTIKELPFEYEMYNIDQYVVHKSNINTTESYKYDIKIELDDGSIIDYSAYSNQLSNIPEGLIEIVSKLEDIWNKSLDTEVILIR